MIRILLQCDDNYFVRAFNGFASTSCQDMEFVCFTELEKAVEHLKTTKSRYSAVIGSPELLAQVSDERVVRMMVSEQTVFSDPEAMRLNIYQPGQVIITDIKNALRLQKGHGTGSGAQGKAYIVSCFSPQGGSGKSTVSYALALAAAQRGKNALYLNFEPIPCYDQLEGHEFTKELDELLFAVKDNRPLERIAADTVERAKSGVLLLPAFHSAGDLLSLTEKQLDAVLRALIEAEDVDYVFIDLPAGFHPLNLWAIEQSAYVLQVFADNKPGRRRIKRCQEDPYYQDLPILGTALTVLNCCTTKEPEDGIDAKIPESRSLRQGSTVVEVQERNPEFLASCMKLLDKIH